MTGFLISNWAHWREPRYAAGAVVELEEAFRQDETAEIVHNKQTKKELIKLYNKFSKNDSMFQWALNKTEHKKLLVSRCLAKRSTLELSDYLTLVEAAKRKKNMSQVVNCFLAYLAYG